MILELYVAVSRCEVVALKLFPNGTEYSTMFSIQHPKVFQHVLAGTSIISITTWNHEQQYVSLLFLILVSN